MVGTIWALIPPVIAIGLALITKEVYLSLMVGIASGALMFEHFQPVEAMYPGGPDYKIRCLQGIRKMGAEGNQIKETGYVCNLSSGDGYFCGRLL